MWLLFCLICLLVDNSSPQEARNLSLVLHAVLMGDVMSTGVFGSCGFVFLLGDGQTFADLANGVYMIMWFYAWVYLPMGLGT